MASAATSPNPTVRFQVNVPETIVLVHPEGRFVKSHFGGDQVMYTLTDGRRMYLDPDVASKIHELGIRPSQPFTICKRERTIGNRRIVDFEVNLPGAAQSWQTATPAPVQSAPTPQFQPSQVTAIPTIEGNGNALLERTGIEAIDVVLKVESYARAKGMGNDFAFGSENIQKVWLAHYIDQARKGARA